MPHIDEHTIEVWVRNPDALPDSVRAEVERRIARYPEWKETAEYWKQYYQVLAEVHDSEQARSVDATRIQLSRVDLQLPTEDPQIEPAADQALEPLAIFSDNESTIVVRCVFNRKDNLIVVSARAEDGLVGWIQLPDRPEPLALDPDGNAVVRATPALLDYLGGSAGGLDIRVRS